jgi:hypothetical protein
MPREILTPDHPRWPEFITRLSDALTRGLPEGTWRCGDDGSGGSPHRYAEAVMAELGGVDIDGTLAFLDEHGAFCDCEILFNLAAADEASPLGTA